MKVLLTGSLSIGLLVAGLFYQIEWAANIGLFYVWFVILLGFVAIFVFTVGIIVGGKEFYDGQKREYSKYSIITKIFSKCVAFATIGILISTGHFIAGSFFTFNFVVLWILQSIINGVIKKDVGKT